MNPTDKKHEQDDKQPSAAERPGEIHRDEQREDRGPTYHGGDWDLSDQEHGREALDEPAEREAESNTDRADEELTDPGTRGAVFGRGGQGLVGRKDENRDEAARAKERDPNSPRRRHSDGS